MLDQTKQAAERDVDSRRSKMLLDLEVEKK